jgi:tetratricopeptide (TPR) repeat protein
VTRLKSVFSARSRDEGNCEAIFQIASEVIEHRRSMAGALNEVRHPALLDSLSDADFRMLDEAIVDSAEEYREYALVLARLAHAAARAKGFDRQIVDAALRLDSFLPLEDPSREREQLLRDAYVIAQRAGYARGGRATLFRLGERALASDEYDRAKTMFQQQLDIADESLDVASDVDAAIMLGDILRREGDIVAAQSYYRRASRSAPRIEYHRGVAESLLRQIEFLDQASDDETVIQYQKQALEAARQTADVGLQSRLILTLAESLARAGRIDEVIDQLEDGVEVAREIGDLNAESECLQALVEAYREQGDLIGVARRQHDLLQLEERLGNRPSAAKWAVRLGTTLMSLDKPQRAVEAYARAHQHSRTLNDPRIEQRALGGLGVAYTALDRPADALENLMKALEIARQTGDMHRQAQWLASIGQALWKFEQPEDAVTALNEGLTIARRIDDMPLQVDLLGLLGEIFDETAQLPRSRECYHRALDLARRLGEKERQIQLMTALGGIAARAQQFSQANALYTQALQLAIEMGDRPAGARLQGRMGKLAQRQRDWPKSLDHYRRAVDIAESVDNPRLTGQLMLHLAAAQHAIGDSGAAGSYRRALALAQQIGDLHREALIRLNLGILLATDGQRAEGLDHLYQAADLVADMGPMGADLARQVDEAIIRVGGNVAAQPSDFRMPPERGFGIGQPPGSGFAPRGQRDDELYSEATLPPR